MCIHTLDRFSRIHFLADVRTRHKGAATVSHTRAFALICPLSLHFGKDFTKKLGNPCIFASPAGRSKCVEKQGHSGRILAAAGAHAASKSCSSQWPASGVLHFLVWDLFRKRRNPMHTCICVPRRGSITHGENNIILDKSLPRPGLILFSQVLSTPAGGRMYA